MGLKKHMGGGALLSVYYIRRKNGRNSAAIERFLKNMLFETKNCEKLSGGYPFPVQYQ